MEESKVYFNGEIIPESEAHISVSDVGFLHGGSVFTTMAAHHGRPFRLRRHIARLLDTVALMGFAGGEATDPDRLATAAMDVLAANDLRRARMRITVTGGDLRTGQPTVLVTAAPLAEYPDAWYAEGVTVAISAFKQIAGDPTYGYKTGCYFPRILARQEAQHKGAMEALWFTVDNRLAEGCFTNVFLVKDGKILTPSRDTPVLPGIMREAAMETARSLGLECDDEAELLINDLLGADEVFITASTMGVVPVTRIERHEVGDGTVGPVTRKIMAELNELVDRETSQSEDDQ